MEINLFEEIDNMLESTNKLSEHLTNNAANTEYSISYRELMVTRLELVNIIRSNLLKIKITM